MIKLSKDVLHFRRPTNSFTICGRKANYSKDDILLFDESFWDTVLQYLHQIPDSICDSCIESIFRDDVDRDDYVEGIIE